MLNWIKERTLKAERKVAVTSLPGQCMQDCINELKQHTLDIVDFFKEFWNKSGKILNKSLGFSATEKLC